MMQVHGKKKRLIDFKPLLDVCRKYFEKRYLWSNLLLYVVFCALAIESALQSPTKWAFLRVVGMALTCLALMFFSIRNQHNNIQLIANSRVVTRLQIQPSLENMPESVLAEMLTATRNKSLSDEPLHNKGIAKKDLIDYFKALLDFYSKYHNHKEISAWGCLVLYVGFCAVAIKTPLPNLGEWIVFWAVAAAFACVALLIFLYIKNQLKLKDTGAGYVITCLFFLAEITASASDSFNPGKYFGSPPDYDYSNSQPVYPLSEAFKKKSAELSPLGRKAQNLTRWLMYGLLVITTLIVLGIKFLEYSHMVRSLTTDGV